MHHAVLVVFSFIIADILSNCSNCMAETVLLAPSSCGMSSCVQLQEHEIYKLNQRPAYVKTTDPSCLSPRAGCLVIILCVKAQLEQQAPEKKIDYSFLEHSGLCSPHLQFPLVVFKHAHSVQQHSAQTGRLNSSCFCGQLRSISHSLNDHWDRLQHCCKGS